MKTEKRINVILILTTFNFILLFLFMYVIIITGNKFLNVANNLAGWKESINATVYLNHEETRRLLTEETMITRGWVKELERIETIKLKGGE